MESPPFKRLTGPIGKSKEFRQTFLRLPNFQRSSLRPTHARDRNLDPASSTLPAPPEHHRPQNTRRKTLVTTSSQNRNAAPRLHPGRIAQFETALCQGTSLLVPIGVSLKIAGPASAGDTLSPSHSFETHECAGQAEGSAPCAGVVTFASRDKAAAYGGDYVASVPTVEIDTFALR